MATDSLGLDTSNAANKKAEADYIKNLQTPGFTGTFLSSDPDAMKRVRDKEATYRPSAEVLEARRAGELKDRGIAEDKANKEALNALTPEQEKNIEQAIGDPNSPIYGMNAWTAYGFLRRLGTTAGDIGQPKGLNLSSIFMPGGANAGSAGIGTGMVINDEGKSVPGSGVNVGFDGIPDPLTPLLDNYIKFFEPEASMARQEELKKLFAMQQFMANSPQRIGPQTQQAQFRGGVR
jgi:hypothetical protein